MRYLNRRETGTYTHTHTVNELKMKIKENPLVSTIPQPRHNHFQRGAVAGAIDLGYWVTLPKNRNNSLATLCTFFL